MRSEASKIVSLEILNEQARNLLRGKNETPKGEEQSRCEEQMPQEPRLMEEERPVTSSYFSTVGGIRQAGVTVM